MASPVAPRYVGIRASRPVAQLGTAHKAVQAVRQRARVVRPAHFEANPLAGASSLALPEFNPLCAQLVEIGRSGRDWRNIAPEYRQRSQGTGAVFDGLGFVNHGLISQIGIRSRGGGVC